MISVAFSRGNTVLIFLVRFFIKGKNEQGTYTAPVAIIDEEDHYLHRDHLGSILAISNSAGTAVEERHFTPWGEVDYFAKNGIVQEDFTDSILPRGFTGHEHFEQVTLIHMNGRLYDPQLRRFIAPDNHIQDPFDTRSYDRKAYVWNNPLMASDPSGEIIQFIIAGAIMGAFNAAANGGNFGDILLGALIGGVAGGLGAGIGNLAAQSLGFAGSAAGFFGNAALSVTGFGAGFVVGFAGGFVGGFVGASLNGLAAGQNIGDAIGGGLRAGLTSGVLAGLAAGIGAGVKARKAGGDFWSGNKETPLVSSVNEIKTKGVQLFETQQPQGGDLNGLRRIEYQNSHLEFDGSSLDIVDNYSNGTRITRDSFSAVSGPGGKGALPNGRYEATNLRIRDTQGMVRDGVGFSVDLEPKFSTTRTYLRIHPDQNPFGTLGCIGIRECSPRLNHLYDFFNGYFKTENKVIELLVNY